MTSHTGHDVDYFVWETNRLILLATKVSDDPDFAEIESFIDAVKLAAPELRSMRNAVTHPEDNKGADDILYEGLALRVMPDGTSDFVVDPLDFELTHALIALAQALRERLTVEARPRSNLESSAG